MTGVFKPQVRAWMVK